jgi:hypothetical protein
MVCVMLGFYTLSRDWYRCPEIRTTSIDCAKLSMFYLNTETESTLRNVAFKYKQAGVLDENRTMDNVQKHGRAIPQAVSQ